MTSKSQKGEEGDKEASAELEGRLGVVSLLSPWSSLGWRPRTTSLGPRTLLGALLTSQPGRWGGGFLPLGYGTSIFRYITGSISWAFKVYPPLFYALSMSSLPPPWQPSRNRDRYSPLAQERQLKFREAESLAWSHPATKWQSGFESHSLSPLGAQLLEAFTHSANILCAMPCVGTGDTRGATDQCPYPWGAGILVGKTETQTQITTDGI